MSQWTSIAHKPLVLQLIIDFHNSTNTWSEESKRAHDRPTRSCHIKSVVDRAYDHFHLVFEFLVIVKKDSVARESYVVCARMKNWMGFGGETKIEFDINLECFIVRNII